MDEEFEIVKGTMTTTQSYTGDQRLLDASHREGLEESLSSSFEHSTNKYWSSQGVVSLVLPQLKGKLNGIALRVPTTNVSVVDLVVNVAKRGLTAEDVNAAFRTAAEGPLKGILAVCDLPPVDVSSTIDSSLTMVMGDDMVNEWPGTTMSGVPYSQRVVDLAHLLAAKWPGSPVAGSGDRPLGGFLQGQSS